MDAADPTCRKEADTCHASTQHRSGNGGCSQLFCCQRNCQIAPTDLLYMRLRSQTRNVVCTQSYFDLAIEDTNRRRSHTFRTNGVLHCLCDLDISRIWQTMCNHG